jgi:hypothetical protein
MPKPSDSEDSFFGRWSRRKRAPATPDEPEAETQAVAPQPILQDDPPVQDDALSPEDLARLPALEDLTPDSDIKAFLQKGVPQALRNAALRRKWMLVPGIRDHKDPAVDYAWDWNTPGGVPGDGHPPSPERAAQMLRDLIAPRNQPNPEATDDTEPTQEDAAGHSLAVTDAQTPSDAEPAPEPAPQNVRLSAAAPKPPAPVRDPVTPDDSAPVSRRRHGGALPG